MSKKLSYLFKSLGILVGVLLMFFGLKFIADAPFKKQLPVNSNTPGLPKLVQQQISAEWQKAYLFTTATTIGKLGMVYHSSGDYESASTCYQLAIKKNTKAWKWNYYLGFLNLEQGQSAEAVKNFKQVCLKDPSNDFALYYLAEGLQKLDSNDSAERLFKQIIINSRKEDISTTERRIVFPLKVYASFQLARVFINSGRNDSAALLLAGIIEEQPAFGPAYRSMANVYKILGNEIMSNNYTVRANDLLDYAPPTDALMNDIALVSRSEQYLLKQMEDAERSANYRWALRLCNHGLTYFPENKIFISVAVFENLRQGFDEKALSYLDKHFNYFKNDAKELMDATDLLYNRQHLEESLKYFNQVKILLPKNSSLAIWLADRGKKDEAIAMMNELLKKNPNDQKIIADNIRLLLIIGDDEMAIKYFKLLKQQSPASPETFQLAGFLANKRLLSDTAVLDYEMAYELDPKDLLFNQSLIDFYIEQKNWPKAISHFRSALNFYPNEPFLLEGLGRILIACPDVTSRNLQEGIMYCQRAFFNYKSVYETKLSAGKNLATAYLYLGDKKNCVKYINRTISVAKDANKSKEYIDYFSALTSRRPS